LAPAGFPTEANLNAKIEALRKAIERQSQESLSLGQDLYRILLQQPSFDREIASAGVEYLLLSLDRRLRYLPFAALRSDEGFLAQKYAIVMLTDAVRDNLSARFNNTTRTMAAFGTTAAAEGSEALPNVVSELNAIVKQSDDPGSRGIIKGTAKLDAEFTLEAFQDAFTTPPTGGSGLTKIVHIASHFQLGSREDSSFLLLGQGQRLPVKELKDNAAVYDFGGIDLLTLSACGTAYASSDIQQGQDLESFATVAQRKGVRAVVATLWPVADSKHDHGV
jgi:CHAT domain-containing protein